ncbi:MAG: lysylphosphatidylglycerol synthase domain-containing protein [Propionibacteriaceae bacterium]|nr:lysylphosphatidylglycerol synthase domain-containing protein [Propionibacteriaceae bacterium]
MLAALVAAVWAVIANWDEVLAALERLPVWVPIVAFALSIAFVWATMVAWRFILNGLGPRVASRIASGIFFVSQVAKYLPGGVWNFVAAAEMGADHAITKRRSVSVLLVSMLVSIVTGLSLAVLAVLAGPDALLSRYWWVLIALPVFVVILTPSVLNRVVNAALGLLKRDRLERDLTPAGLYRSAAVSLCSWLIAGAQVWLILGGLTRTYSLESFFLCLGGYALAWVVGFLVFFVPAGVGIREVVLGAVLGSAAGAGDVVVVVLMSRILFTVADVCWGVWASIRLRRDSVRLRARGQS